MSEWRHHRLKRAQLDPHTVIGIPEDWDFGRDEENDRFWCGREDGDVTLFVQNAVLTPRKGTIERSVEGTVAFLEGVPGRKSEVELSIASPGEALVHAVVDHEEDGAPFRTFRWYLFRKVDDDTVAHLRFVLSMPVARSGDPANRELVEIFAEQMAQVRTGDPEEDPLWRAVQAWRRTPEAERAGCRRGWHRLRISNPFGFIRMLVPEAWPVDEWDAAAEMWCLCDEPDDEVTLWIDYHVFALDGPVDDATLARISDGATEARSPYVEDRGRVPHASGGVVQRSVHTGEEQGELLRYFRWDVTTRAAPGSVSVYFSLVISPSLQDTPDEALLVRLFDEEIPRCEIGEPPAPASKPGLRADCRYSLPKSLS